MNPPSWREVANDRGSNSHVQSRGTLLSSAHVDATVVFQICSLGLRPASRSFLELGCCYNRISCGGKRHRLERRTFPSPSAGMPRLIGPGLECDRISCRLPVCALYVSVQTSAVRSVQYTTGELMVALAHTNTGLSQWKTPMKTTLGICVALYSMVTGNFRP